jgi:hypothetical protein
MSVFKLTQGLAGFQVVEDLIDGLPTKNINLEKVPWIAFLFIFLRTSRYYY